MLTDYERELLTAAIDAELNLADQKIVQKLLKRSAEARTLYIELQQDAQRIQNSLRKPMPIDFADTVVKTIQLRSLTPTPLPPHKSNTQRPWYQRLLPHMLAASILLLVSASSFLHFLNQEAEDSPKKSLVLADSRPVRDTNMDIPEESPDTNTESILEKNKDVVPVVVLPKTKNNAVEEVIPNPREVETKIFTTPSSTTPEMVEIAKIRLSLVLPLRELDQAYPKQKLREEIVKDDLIRIDLFCKDSSRAYEVIHAKLRKQGHLVFSDHAVLEKIKKKQTGEFVFFTEAFSALEVADLLETLGEVERKLVKEKNGEGQLFDQFVLTPSLPKDVELLARMLGIPANQIKPNIKKGMPTDVDVRKPLSETTANQLNNLIGSRMAAKSEKTTLVLPYTNRSYDVKPFLDKRGERKPNTVPLMLVLRVVG